MLRDFTAGLSNFFGGRSGAYEEELTNARETALRELEQRAQERGANAVVGVDVDYEVLGSNNGMLMVTASGTAARRSSSVDSHLNLKIPLLGQIGSGEGLFSHGFPFFLSARPANSAFRSFRS